MLTDLSSRLRRAPMFRDYPNTIATLGMGAVMAWLTYRFATWAVTDAIWTLPEGAGSEACAAVGAKGACWAVIHERFRFILFGAYPFAEQWRSALACGVFVSLCSVTAMRACWKFWLLGVWLAGLAAVLVLLRGGVLGLTVVATDFWGGLPLTFGLSTMGFGAAFPLAVLLALGRRSQMPAIWVLSTAYIETVRAIPLVTFLFMASAMFPLFMPHGVTIDKLFRAQVAFVMVITAYLAEVVRAGLDAVPSGQHEAAASLGLDFWRTTVLVLLPQGLRIAIPALVNTFIIFFKDTSLVAIIGVFDLLGAAKAVIVDAKWAPFGVEVYLFAGAVYYAFCFAVSRYTQHLERTLGGSRPLAAG